MADRDDSHTMRRRIHKGALPLFLKNGYSNTTTDDIARALGMSKKTLYQYYSGKRALFEDVVDAMLSTLKAEFDTIDHDASAGSIEKIKRTFHLVGSRISLLGPLLVSDMFRTLPDVWEKIDTFRKGVIFGRLRSHLTEAQKQGLIRQDIDDGLLTTIHFLLLPQMITPHTLSQIPYSPGTVLEAIVNIIYSGALTGKGREQFGTLALEQTDWEGVL